ncbi:ATP-binding protein [Leptospira sp. 85282-16]|uniref:ATP-binding protein n=1 Tax=Leptospira sp. 85282-16 TaxID=2971256 RepID=UPI0021BE7751|nr:ATP-binding protein [Leptospira sp. 85282-16]MCT8334794.1 ATP-binding protein [Leptospira sp. 85282-16]
MGSGDEPKKAVLLLSDFIDDWLDKNRRLIDKKSVSYSYIAEIEKLSNSIRQSTIKNLNFPDDSAGTSFYILGTKDEVIEIFRERSKNVKMESHASEGLKTFLGFCNPFTDAQPRLITKTFVDQIEAYKGADLFWKADDFKNSDYEIELTITEDGFAKGKVRRFSEVYKYEFQYNELPERSIYPGAMTLKFGYVLGLTSETSLPHEKHKYFNEKLKQIGGLYVYRDDIRVMPYGRDDQDFLEFEYRRNLSAGEYVFSHRRMFGYVGITSKGNSGLRDKAGREGFIKDKYYRGFTHILKDVFIDLAKTYFATSAKAEYASSLKSKEKPFDQEAKEETSRFIREFNDSKKTLEKLKKTILNDLSDFKDRLSELKTGNIESINQFMNDLAKFREKYNDHISTLIDEIPNLAQPNGKNHAAWDSYLTDKQLFVAKSDKQMIELSKHLDAALKKYSDKYEYLKKLESRLKNQENRILTRIEEKKDEISTNLAEIQKNKIKNWFDKHKKDIESMLRNQLGDNPPLQVVNGKGDELEIFERALIDQNKLAKETIEPYWESILKDIKRIAEARSMESAVGELHRELEKLKERESIYIELAQLGLIVEGIDHEYRVLFKRAKNDFKKLNKNFQEEDLSDLETVFYSINEKIESLSPLYRAGKRKYETVLGDEITQFIGNRFKEEFTSGAIQLSKSISKLNWKNTNRSVLYASIINIINNSFYWIAKSSSKPEIRLTIDPLGLVISDSGPGVAVRDRERIFEPYFSRKPTGRGLGLYLSMTALKFHGMDLLLAENPMKNALDGANFVIVKPVQDDEDD